MTKNVKNTIDYSILIDEAMHGIVKKCLEIFSKHHDEQKNHFFISFLTDFPGVKLSEKLCRRYPEEMTIVLQYQFEDLKIDNDKFSVVLSFDNSKECIEVPFKSMTAFADPSMRFGLQFKQAGEADLFDDEFDEDDDYDNIGDINLVSPIKHIPSQASSSQDTQKNKAKSKGKSNVIDLESFRKKK